MTRTPAATVLVAIALRDFEPFHDPAGEPYVTTRDAPRETYRLRSREFRARLARTYFRELGDAVSDTAIATALTTLAGIAQEEGPEDEVYLRVAGDRGRVWLDLADAKRRVVEIDGEGWGVTEDTPVRFIRPPGMLPLPAPVACGSLADLRRFLNLPDRESHVLVGGFLLGTLHPTGPYPVLSLTGPEGSAKSTAARVLRDLVDPNRAPLRAPPGDVRDLAVATRGSRVMAFDNLSRITTELSDAFCGLSTGRAFAARALYTDADEVTFQALRPVIITSIPDVVTASDLSDRTIRVALGVIAEGNRVPEEEFWAEFHRARPGLLGALCNAVAGALGRTDGVRLDRLPRMADLARWITAAEPALGWRPGTFVSALHANRQESAVTAVEGSLLGRVIVDLAHSGGFTGTATELLGVLRRLARGEAHDDPRWPRDARGLSRALNRMTADLDRLGVVVTRRRTGREGRKVIEIGLTSRLGETHVD